VTAKKLVTKREAKRKTQQIGLRCSAAEARIYKKLSESTGMPIAWLIREGMRIIVLQNLGRRAAAELET